MTLEILEWRDLDYSWAKCPVTGKEFSIFFEEGAYWPTWDPILQSSNDLAHLKGEAENFRNAIIERHSKSPFQERTWDWALSCVGEDNLNDMNQRGDRLLEEIFETLQAGGYDPARISTIRDHVFSKEPGDLAHETGDAMVGIAAWCGANGLDMEAVAEAALERNIANTDKIRERQAHKPFAELATETPAP